MKKPEEILNSEEKLEAANRNIETDSWGEYNQQEKRWVVSPVSGGIIRLFIQRLYGLVQKLNRLYSSINVDNYDTEEGVLVETYKTITIPQDGGNITVNVKAYEKVTNVYQISFNTNGGNEIQPVNVITNQEYVLPTPTFGDWTFDGWYNSEGEKVTSINQSELEPVIVTAKWKTNITLTDSNGDRVVEVNRNEEYNLPAAAKKQGYNGQYFDIDSEGWFRGNIQILGGLIISEPNIKLVAKYPEICEVNFNTNIENLTYNSWYVPKGTTITLPTLTFNNYHFLLWNELLTSSYTIRNNCTFNAVWYFTIILKYGNTTISQDEYYKGSNITLDLSENIRTLIESAGYNITGWQGSNNISYTISLTYTDSGFGDITFTLQTSAKENTITWEPTNSTNKSRSTTTVLTGQTINVPYTDMERKYNITWNNEGTTQTTFYSYKFVRWEDSNGNPLTSSTKATKNETYHPVWQEATTPFTIPTKPTKLYTITWDGGGGGTLTTTVVYNSDWYTPLNIPVTSNTIPTSDVTYSVHWIAPSRITLPENPPTLVGFIFKGWATEGSNVVNVTTSSVPSKDVTYHAIWTQDVAEQLTMYSFRSTPTDFNFFDDPNIVSGTTTTYQDINVVVTELLRNIETRINTSYRYHYIKSDTPIVCTSPESDGTTITWQQIGEYNSSNNIYLIQRNLNGESIKYN